MERINLLFGFCLFLGFVSACDLPLSRAQADKIGKTVAEYTGEIDGFTVLITETQREGEHVQQIVHLYAKVPGSTNVNAIMGHDYNADGRFDRVFFCGSHELIYRCNSVVFSDGGGKWRWEPCPSDRSRVPFTDQEVFEAQALLYLALSRVRN